MPSPFISPQATLYVLSLLFEDQPGTGLKATVGAVCRAGRGLEGATARRKQTQTKQDKRKADKPVPAGSASIRKTMDKRSLGGGVHGDVPPKWLDLHMHLLFLYKHGKQDFAALKLNLSTAPFVGSQDLLSSTECLVKTERKGQRRLVTGSIAHADHIFRCCAMAAACCAE